MGLYPTLTGNLEGSLTSSSNIYEYIFFLVNSQVFSCRELDLYDNTIVVFLADHGFHIGDHGHWGKNTLYGLSNRIPLLMKVGNI